jgi:hypothetical protein
VKATHFLALGLAFASQAASPPAAPTARVVFFVEHPWEDEFAIPIACVRDGSTTLVFGPDCLEVASKHGGLGGSLRGNPSLGTPLSTPHWCGWAPDTSEAVKAVRVARTGRDVPRTGVATPAVWPVKAATGLAPIRWVDWSEVRLHAELEHVSRETKIPISELRIEDAAEFDADGDGVSDFFMLVTEPASGKWVGPKRIRHSSWLFTSRSGVHQIAARNLVAALDLDGDGRMELFTLDPFQWGVFSLDGTRLASGPACNEGPSVSAPERAHGQLRAP